MTNLDGLAVLLFVMNSATGNGLGTQLLQVKRVVSHVACSALTTVYNRADAHACQRVPRASARSARTRCRVRTRNEIRRCPVRDARHTGSPRRTDAEPCRRLASLPRAQRTA